MYHKLLMAALSVVIALSFTACAEKETAAPEAVRLRPNEESAARLQPNAASGAYLEDDGEYDDAYDETYDDGDFYEDMSDDTYDDYDYETDDPAALLAQDFSLAYTGAYNENSTILLGMGDYVGLAAIINTSNGALEWVCYGDLSESGSGYLISDSGTENSFSFAISEHMGNSIEIQLQDGYLMLDAVNLDEIYQFFTDMDNGYYS